LFDKLFFLLRYHQKRIYFLYIRFLLYAYYVEFINIDEHIKIFFLSLLMYFSFSPHPRENLWIFMFVFWWFQLMLPHFGCIKCRVYFLLHRISRHLFIDWSLSLHKWDEFEISSFELLSRKGSLFLFYSAICWCLLPLLSVAYFFRVSKLCFLIRFIRQLLIHHRFLSLFLVEWTWTFRKKFLSRFFSKQISDNLRFRPSTTTEIIP
jgi:hypothetical protein